MLYRGYGQVDRPSRVPAGYVRVERDLGIYATGEEADAVAATWEKPAGTLESEVTQNQLDEGVQVTATYWAPPAEAKRPGWVIALAGGAAGLSVLGMGLGVITSQGRRRR